MSEVTRELREQIEAELEPGEQILWIGRPRAGRFVLRMLPVFAFGLVWTGLCSVMFTGEARQSLYNAPGPFILFPIIFPAVGIIMILAPFWALYKAGRTMYAVTDRRAILREQTLSTKVRSYAADRLGNLERRERSDGSGDIIFERRVSVDSDGDRHTTQIGFWGIENVREVERLLRQVPQATA